jgi:hypothetical protein
VQHASPFSKKVCGCAVVPSAFVSLANKSKGSFGIDLLQQLPLANIEYKSLRGPASELLQKQNTQQKQKKKISAYECPHLWLQLYVTPFADPEV